MTWTYTVSAPSVGQKITAAGHGAQVAHAVAEIHTAIDTLAPSGVAAARAELDGLELREVADPGRLCPGLQTVAVTAAAGTSTVVAAPGSGTRVVKALGIHAPSSGTTVQLQVGGAVRASWTFSASGETGLSCTVPMTSSDTGGMQVVVTGGTAYVTASYVDRADVLIARADMALALAADTPFVPGGAGGRTITQLWMAAVSTGTTATLKVGSSVIRNALPVTAGGILVVSQPIYIPPSTALTAAADGTNTLSLTAAFI